MSFGAITWIVHVMSFCAPQQEQRQVHPTRHCHRIFYLPQKWPCGNGSGNISVRRMRPIQIMHGDGSHEQDCGGHDPRKDGRSTFIVHDTATATSRHPQLSGVAAMEGLLVRNDRPRLLRPAAGLCAGRQRDARRAAQVSAASGASRSQRAEHAPVPLVRRDPAPIPACHGRQRGCAPGGPRVCRTRRIAIAASRAHLEAARATQTSPGQPLPAAGCVQGGPSVCRIWRTSIATSQARPLAARATRPPPPATAGEGVCSALRSQGAQHVSACHGRRRDVRRAAHVCATSGGPRSQRAEHVPVPLVRW
jgi:hypothetical protein